MIQANAEALVALLLVSAVVAVLAKRPPNPVVVVVALVSGGGPFCAGPGPLRAAAAGIRPTDRC